ncbi:hypothetical protein [Pseudomonas sp. CBC3]|uniref:hypothetical protein n=1 Tax=Pseudomonas sp. CBC3 TaxID=3123318 RepID=UPI0030EA0505
MTPSQTINIARDIMRGDCALHYFTIEHERIAEKLSDAILSPKGEVILLHGSAGCGISTLMNALQKQHSLVSKVIGHQIFIDKWDFVDHLCAAYYVRRIRTYKNLLPEHLLKVISLSQCKTIFIDDLDICIANEYELREVYGVIQTISSKVDGLNFVISVRDKRLVSDFLARAQASCWSSYAVPLKIQIEEYYDLASRIWNDLNSNHSITVIKDLESLRLHAELELDKAYKRIHLKFVEHFLKQQGLVSELTAFKTYWEHDDYIQSILYSCAVR